MNNKVSKKTTKKGWWKIAIFALGVLLVVGAVAYAVIMPHSDAVGTPSIKGSASSAVAAAGVNAPATPGIGDLTWVKELGSVFADHDFIFVLLPGSDSGSTEKVANQVIAAAAKIEAVEGVSVDTLTLSPNNPEFSITADRLAISKLPAVLAFSSSGNGAIVTGEITETKLLQVYVVASQPVCLPGSSSGCCPTN